MQPVAGSNSARTPSTEASVADNPQDGEGEACAYVASTESRGGDTAPTVAAAKEALLREVLERIADKWTLIVIEELSSETPVRFTELRDRIGGVSQKMLTKTLRQLERDGLVTRRVHPVIPPRVDYTLTPLGESLGESVCGIWMWVEEHMDEVVRLRAQHDARA